MVRLYFLYMHIVITTCLQYRDIFLECRKDTKNGTLDMLFFSEN